MYTRLRAVLHMVCQWGRPFEGIIREKTVTRLVTRHPSESLSLAKEKENLRCLQEAPVSITFGRHVSNRLKIIYSEILCRELSIGVYMGRIGEGWSPDGFSVFLGSPVFFWITSTEIEIYHRNP